MRKESNKATIRRIFNELTLLFLKANFDNNFLD